jgi:tetratricopeptide (TPR) repeat protein
VTRACLSADELVDAVQETLPAPAQQHLLGCQTCAARVALLRRIDVGGVENIAAAAGDVETVIAGLLVTPRDRWWRAVREEQYQRPEVVRRLVALAGDVSGRDGKLAVALVTTATRIIDVLPRNQPDVCALRFDTWKFASAILREAGKYEDTEVALARAEEAAPAAADPELAEALVLFYRALLFAEPDVWRPEEAAALLDRVEVVFTRRDPVRRRAVLITRAFLLYRAGDFRSACTAFAQILATTSTESRDAYLHALTNSMFARVELGEANEEVARAIDLLITEYSALGHTEHLARARWLMGEVRRFRGEYAESEELLRGAMREIGNSDTAIRVGLDLLETLLLAERYGDAMAVARELAAEAVALDRREPNRRRSLTAAVFAYAREAAQRGALTADLVSELSRYVDRIYRQRPTDFIPPMPLAHM